MEAQLEEKNQELQRVRVRAEQPRTWQWLRMRRRLGVSG